MYGIVVTAHNKFSSGLYSAVKFVTGESENVEIVDYLEGQNYDQLDNNLKEAYKKLKEKGYEKIIFITDLVGGTPFSRAVMNFEEDKNTRVISGMNFAMLYIASITKASENMDDDIDKILKEAQGAIAKYQIVNKEETSSDGI
ncbi:MAG: PTS sugar transporter subunit IIA [Peptoniphilaceae bacterium]